MENQKEQSNWATVWLFAVGAFLNDLGYYLIVTIWPIFVTSVLGASVTFLGFVDGLGDALVSLSQAASGFLSDRLRKRKVFIWLGYLFAFISRVIYGLAVKPWQVVPGKIFDRGGKMRDAPRDAIVADAMPHEKRASAFGLMRAADRGGAVVGLLVSIVLVGYLSYRNLFFIAAIPSLIGSLIILFFVREKIRADHLAPEFSFKFVSRDLKIFTALSLIFTLGAFSDSFYILAAHRLGVSIKLVPIFFMMYLVFSSLFAFPFGKLSDKIGRVRVLTIAFILFIIVNLIFIFYPARGIASNWVYKYQLLILAAFIIYGLHTAAYEANIKTIVAEFAPKNLRSSIIGSFQMLVGFMALPASLIAGLLWDKVSFEAPFIFSLFAATIALLITFLLKNHLTRYN